MKKVQSKAYGVVSSVVTTSTMQIDRVQGYFRGAVASWLQFHDAKALPANGAVPIKSFLQPTTSAFHWGFDPGELVVSNGLVVVMSTTEGTLTASAEVSDFLVDGEQTFDDTGASTTGDYTTAVQTRNIWLQANGPKRLLRLEFTALTGAGSTLYAKIFAHDSPSFVTSQRPLVTINLTIGTSKDVFFNFSPLASNATEQNKTGCYVLIDDVPGGASGEYVGTDFAIKGTYI